MRPTQAAFATALLITSAIPGAADVVHLKNGRTLEGKVRTLPDGKVEITQAFGTFAFSGSQVARVERGTSVEEIVEEALAVLAPGDVEGLYELALWCEEKGEHTLATRVMARILAVDPDHQGARQALGYRQLGSRWLTEEEAHVARGEVLFRGSWIDREERARVLAAEADERRQRHLEEMALLGFELELARLELEAERSAMPPPGGLPLSLYPASPYVPTYPQPPHHHPRALPAAPQQPRPQAPADPFPRHLRSGFAAPR